MSDQLEKLLAQKPMKKPAKAWRNWWKVLLPIYWEAEDECGEPGDIYCSAFAWPSKEIAEQKAADDLAEEFARLGFNPEQHIGAFPEGERP